MHKCSIAGCERKAYSRNGPSDGWCRRHHLSWRKYGDPLVGLRRAFEERVDKSAGPEGCWLWTGGTVPNLWGDYGYFHNQYVHRLAYMFAHNLDALPAGMEIDHVCHTRLCVNAQHLRLVTSSQNKEHRLGAQSNSRTGVRGVIKTGDRFRAVVRRNGVNVYAGTYRTVEEAGEAARLKRLELFTHNDVDRQSA